MRIRLFVVGLVLGLVATACTTSDTATSGIAFPTTTTTVSIDPPPTTAPGASPITTTTLAAPATTTTTMVSTSVAGDIPVAAVVASVEADYQARWDYYQPEKPRGVVGPVAIKCDNSGDVAFGAVLQCEATPQEEREYWPDPFAITVLVTGEDATHWYEVGGSLVADYQTIGAGMFCRDLIASESTFAGYPHAVAYWFMEGQPDRMDADRDGIPCETVFTLWDIAGFWHGTSRGEATDIHFGTVTDVAARGSGYELTIDYAFFLGGLEADLAAEAAGDIGPGEGVPNDYFIVNDNPRLRTFPLADGVDVLLLGSRQQIEPIPVALPVWIDLLAEVDRCETADWPDDCARIGGDDWHWYGNGHLPYWIQLEGDTVIRIEEQYLP